MHMTAKRLHLHNKFLNDYQNQNNWLLDQFDYNPYSHHVFNERMKDLNERSFNREDLADVLKKLNNNWGAPKETFQNIEKLRDENSLVVIGGQQAGILSGPLYTIHKIISIITLADQQEKELGVPVLPVFWIAGEDHDYDEVNHIFLPQESQLQKKALYHDDSKKVSLSKHSLDKEKVVEWLEEVFRELKETDQTKYLWSLLNEKLEQSESLVDFFALFIHKLFECTGLILIDSGDEKVRLLEKNMFEQLIKKQSSISKGVYQSLQSMRSRGYSISVDVEEDDGHLFIEENGERILLKKEGDSWVGKNQECAFSTDEMVQIAREQPERLSNNVVTRPVMQEMLFPTLAFFAGPSEAAYWSILKPAFQTFSMKMPPVLPRISMTFVENKITKWIEKYDLSLSTILNKGVQPEKQNWLISQSNPPLDILAEQFKQTIVNNHMPFKAITKDLGDDVTQYADKNLHLILEQVNQLTNRLHQEFSAEYKQHLDEFDAIELKLRPNNGLQERMWNVIYFLNYYGMETIQEILTSTYDWKDGHYVVYI